MDQPAHALRRIFGFQQFRPGQAEAVAAALAGRDALVVMPTGSGKSICYQLPALMRDELTLVVSPLVSLMQDQIGALSSVAPGQAAVIHGQRRADENASAMERVRSGEVRLLYVAPERFAARGFLEAMGAARVGLFVVDEAHCVSQWGHDFRPDYFALAEVGRILRARGTMALTATATPRVADPVRGRARQGPAAGARAVGSGSAARDRLRRHQERERAARRALDSGAWPSGRHPRVPRWP
jgi:ATP-dependent DNA helicase RecQ